MASGGDQRVWPTSTSRQAYGDLTSRRSWVCWLLAWARGRGQVKGADRDRGMASLCSQVRVLGDGAGKSPLLQGVPNVGTWVKGERFLLHATGLQERPAEAANGVQGVAHPSFLVGDVGIAFLQQLCREYEGFNARLLPQAWGQGASPPCTCGRISQGPPATCPACCGHLLCPLSCVAALASCLTARPEPGRTQKSTWALSETSNQCYCHPHNP